MMQPPSGVSFRDACSRTVARHALGTWRSRVCGVGSGGVVGGESRCAWQEVRDEFEGRVELRGEELQLATEVACVPMLNAVHLVGRLTADPTTVPTASGTMFCRFTIAVNRYNTATADCIDVVTQLSAQVTDNLVILRLRTDGDAELEQWAARRRRELFEKVFDRELEVIVEPAARSTAAVD